MEIGFDAMLAVAIEEAQTGLAEGGVPVGAALFDGAGVLLARGRNRRLQHGDATAHAEVEAFRAARRRDDYRDVALVTTNAPCWLCSGLVRQFGIGTLVVGDSTSVARDGLVWLERAGVKVVELHSIVCEELLRSYVDAGGDFWAPVPLADPRS